MLYSGKLRLLSARNGKKKENLFSLISKPKAFSPAEAALPGFRHRLTSVVPGAPLPCALGLVRLQHMLQQQRDALQGKYSPGESLGTSTEGKRMTFQTSYSLLVRVTGAVKHPPAGFRAAGPGPSSITLLRASPLFASVVVPQRCQFQFFSLSGLS